MMDEAAGVDGDVSSESSDDVFTSNIHFIKKLSKNLSKCSKEEYENAQILL